MVTITLEFDERTVHFARKRAEEFGTTLEAWLTRNVEQLAREGETGIPMWGLFADEPELIEQIVEEAMIARGRDRTDPAIKRDSA